MKATIEKLKRLKGIRKVTVLTAYDYQVAKILDGAGIDIILVGDSLGMVVLGYKNTWKVKMADMIRATASVARGSHSAVIVGDMPINTYNTIDDALLNAQMFLDAGAHAVKVEGNHPDVLEALISSGIPIMGHLGLLPQTAKLFKVQGKKKREAESILTDAKELDKLGVFSIVLECIPLSLAKQVTEAVQSLTIGIGAGIYCDGQVLVVNDMLGMDPEFKPKHNKQYANLYEVIKNAVGDYIDEVINNKFPTDEQSFH
jgi:3-methyl-2-oxobutanoate hydroxymethyltransferase